MNPTLTLSHQPVSVLVALFNAVAHKRLENGDVSPLCIKICELLNSRGYDIANLDFRSGRTSKASISSK